MCGGLLGGSVPKMPNPTVMAAPAATSIAKTMEDETVTSARKEEEQRRRARAGQKSTNATGGGGLGEAANSNLGGKSLLGS